MLDFFFWECSSHKSTEILGLSAQQLIPSNYTAACQVNLILATDAKVELSNSEWTHGKFTPVVIYYIILWSEYYENIK